MKQYDNLLNIICFTLYVNVHQLSVDFRSHKRLTFFSRAAAAFMKAKQFF